MVFYLEIKSRRTPGKGEGNGVQFLGEETWFCIRALILAHVCVIEIFCIKKNVSVIPRSMNTDTVEWTFRDERQMVGGSHNKLIALGFDSGDKKSNAFNCLVVNRSGCLFEKTGRPRAAKCA